MGEVLSQGKSSDINVSVIGATKTAKELISKIKILLSDEKLEFDPFISSMLDGYINKVFIRSYILDSICKPSNATQETIKKWKEKIALVIYNPISTLFYGNETYVRATELGSLQELQLKSKTGLLNNELYEGQNLASKIDIMSRLEKGIIEDIVDTPLSMKSGEKFRWYARKKSLRMNNGSNEDFAIKIGINIGETEGGNSIENGTKKPLSYFDFYKAVEMIEKSLESLFKSNPQVHEELKIGIKKDINKLKMLSQIGDEVVDFGPLPLYFHYKQETFLNNMFLKISGYDKKTSMEMLMDPNDPTNIGSRLGDSLFGTEIHGNIRTTGGCGTVNLTRKNQDNVELILNATNLSDKGEQLWIGIINSPIYPIFTNDEILEDMENITDNNDMVFGSNNFLDM
ncbi:MAG: hypothetical protein PHZ26_03270 [Candidatus Gracilibacteria bacterium]|nr:hypothetical protein [Candidatus Gracilibacteria bacterium]MDD2908748.1 hypothetical protein [Candidatus Gracilibacteria bacterium]